MQVPRQVIRAIRSGITLMGRGPRAAVAALVLALAVLSVLVHRRALDSFDQYSVDHLMPAFHPTRHGEGGGLRGLVLPFGRDTTGWSKVLDTWDYPASVLASALVVAVVFVALRRRGRPVAGIVWIGAWFAGNAAEVLGKAVIVRSPLFGTTGGGRVHISAFDQSFPSGHTLRSILIAAAALYVWRRLAVPAIAWALTVGPALVASGAHTASDVVGGGLLGLLVVVVAWVVADAAPADPRARPSRG